MISEWSGTPPPLPFKESQLILPLWFHNGVWPPSFRGEKKFVPWKSTTTTTRKSLTITIDLTAYAAGKKKKRWRKHSQPKMLFSVTTLRYVHTHTRMVCKTRFRLTRRAKKFIYSRNLFSPQGKIYNNRIPEKNRAFPIMWLYYSLKLLQHSGLEYHTYIFFCSKKETLVFFYFLHIFSAKCYNELSSVQLWMSIIFLAS